MVPPWKVQKGEHMEQPEGLGEWERMDPEGEEGEGTKGPKPGNMQISQRGWRMGWIQAVEKGKVWTL